MDAAELFKNGYAAGAKRLDEMLAKNPGDGELCLMRAYASYMQKSYDYAIEMAENAILNGKVKEGLRLKGAVFFSKMELERSLSCYEELALLSESDGKSDCEALFFAWACRILLVRGDPSPYLSRAYQADRPKAVQLLQKFYSEFIDRGMFSNKSAKAAIKAKLDALSAGKSQGI
jgi:hypothetical protein